MKWLYFILAFISLFLAVFFAYKGDVAFTVLYCFCIHWNRDWMIREDGDTNG